MSDLATETTAPAEKSEGPTTTAATSRGPSPSSPSSSTGHAHLKSLSYKAAAALLSPNSPQAQDVAAQGVTGGGQGLDAGLSNSFTKSTGVDISHGRRHTGPAVDAACSELGVQGYTLGSDVALGSGAGAAVEMHEYAHVAQQTGVAGPQTQAKGSSAPPSADLEQQADDVADAALAGRPAQVSVGVSPQVQGKGKDDVDTTDDSDTAAKEAETKPTPAPAEVQQSDPEPTRLDPEVLAMFRPMSSQKRRKVLKQHDGDIEKMNEWLSTGWLDWAITDSEANKVMAKLEQMNSVPERSVVIQALGRHGKLEDLWSNIPDKSGKQHPKALLSLIAHGAPGDATDMAKYTLVRQSPAPFEGAEMERTFFFNGVSNTFLRLAATQPTTRGKHIEEWMAGLKDPVQKRCQDVYTLAKGQFETQQVEDKKSRDERAEKMKEVAAASDTAMKTDKELFEAVTEIKGLLELSFTDWAVTNKEARKVFQLLKDLNNTGRVQAAVYQMDQGKWMERFLDNLPEKDRWNDAHTFLAILTARDPMKNVKYAKELLTTSFWSDWAVTDREASLAFQLAKSMPSDIQRQFREADDGKWWEKMQGELSESKKNDKDVHFYSNKEELQKLKLALQKEAGSMTVDQLRVQIEMLMRAGEVDFVEQTLLAAGLDKSDAHRSLYLKFGFATSTTKRNETIYQTWKAGSTKGDKLTAGKVGEWFAGLAEAGELLAKGIVGGIASKASGGNHGGLTANIDLQQLATLVGRDGVDTLMGAGIRFGDRGKDSELNTVDIDASLGDGQAGMKSPGFVIDSISSLQDGTKLEVGNTLIGAIEARLKWPTAAGDTKKDKKEDKPAGAIELYFKVDSMSAKDVWQITQTGMVTAGLVTLGELEVSASLPDNVERPANSQEGASLALRSVTDTLMRFMRGLNLSDPSPEAIASHFGSAASGGMAMTIKLASATVENIGTSAKGGEHVGKVTVGASEIKVTQGKMTAHLEKQIADLKAQEDEAARGDAATSAAVVEKLAEQRKKLTQRLEEVRLLEPEYAALLAKQKDPKGGLKDHEYERFKELQALVSVSEMDLDVGAIHLENVNAGGVKAKSLDIGPMKGELTATTGTDAKGDTTSELSGTLDVDSIKAADVEQQAATRLETLDARIATLNAKIEGGKGEDGDLAEHAKLTKMSKAVHKLVEEKDALLLGGKPQTVDGTLRTLAVVKKDLADWVTRPESTKVESVSLVGKDGQPGLRLGISSADGGTVSIQTGVFDATMAQAESLRTRLVSRQQELKAVEQPNPQQLDELSDIDKSLAEYAALEAEAQAKFAEVNAAKDALAARKKAYEEAKPKPKEKPDFIPDEVKVAALEQQLANVQAKVDAFNASQGGTVHTEDASLKLKGVGSVGELLNFDPTKRPLTVEVDIPTMKISSLAFAADPTSMKAESVTVAGVKVALEVALENKREPAKDPKPGEPATVDSYGLKSGTLRVFDVESIDATTLDVKFPIGKEILHLNVPTAAIKGVKIRDIPLVGFDPLKFKGTAEMESFDMKFKADLTSAIADPKKGLMPHFAAGGHIKAGGMELGEFEKGKTRFKFGSASLEDFMVTGDKEMPKGSLAESLAGVGATVKKAAVKNVDAEFDQLSGGMTFGMDIDDVNINNVSYVGGGNTVKLGSATATKGRVDVTAVLDLDQMKILGKELPEGASQDETIADARAKEAAGKKVLKSGKVTLLKFDKVTGNNLHYHGVDNDGAQTTVDLKKGWFEGFELTDFDLVTGSFGLDVQKGGIEGMSAKLQSDVKDYYKKTIGKTVTTLSGVKGELGGVHIDKDSDGKYGWDIKKGSMEGTAQADTYGPDGKVLQSHTEAQFGGSFEGSKGSMDANGDVETEIAKVNGKATVFFAQAPSGVMNLTVSGNATGIKIGYKKAAKELTLSCKTGNVTVKGEYKSGEDVYGIDMTVSASVEELKYSEKGFSLKMGIPTAKLNPGMKIHIGGKYATDVTFVGGAAATGTTIDVEGEFFPPNEAAKRAATTYDVIGEDGKKTKASLNTLKTLTVNTIDIPSVSVSALKVEVKTPKGILVVDVPSANVKNILVEALKMKDDKGQLESIGGSITTGKMDTSAISAKLGDSMSAFLGNAGLDGGLTLKMLSDGSTDVSLDKLYAGALTLTSADKSLGGSVTLKQLKVASLEVDADEGGVDVTAKKSSATLTGDGHGKAITTGDTKDTVYKEGTSATKIKVDILKKLNGHLRIAIPWKGRAGLPVEVGVTNGQAHVKEIPLPDGYLLRHVFRIPKAAYTKLPQFIRDKVNSLQQKMVAKAIDMVVQNYLSEYMNLPRLIEGSMAMMVNEQQAAAGSKGETYSFEAMKKRIEGSWSGLDEVLDMFAPGGKGVIRTAIDEVDKAVHIFDTAEEDAAQELRDKKRRMQLLYSWINGISLDTNLSTEGNLEGWTFPVDKLGEEPASIFAKVKAWDFDKVQSVYGKTGDFKKFLSANALFTVKGKGTIGTGFDLKMHANVRKFDMDMGAFKVSGKGVVLNAQANINAKDLDQVSGKATVAASAEELTMGMDLGAPPTDPVELAKWKREKARIEANEAAQRAAWERYNKKDSS